MHIHINTHLHIQKPIFPYLYTNLTVCLYPINVKTAKPIRPKLWPSDVKYIIMKYFYLKLFYFVKFENERKNIMKLFLFYTEKMLTDKAKI